MTDKELGYVAGIVDGEGTIGISYRTNRSGNGSYSLFLAVKMCNQKVVERIREFTGLGNIIHCPSYNNRWREQWRWQVNGKEAKSILDMLWPLLVEKKEQALLAIEFQTRFPQKQGKSVSEEMNNHREMYRLALKELKNRK